MLGTHPRVLPAFTPAFGPGLAGVFGLRSPHCVRGGSEPGEGQGVIVAGQASVGGRASRIFLPLLHVSTLGASPLEGGGASPP